VSTPSTSQRLEPSAIEHRTRLPTLSSSKWFSEVVHPHDSSLKAYIRGSFPTVRDVDDLVQESYLRVWKRQTAKPIESVKSFLFTVARHLALGTLRRERRSPIFDLVDLDTASVIDDRPGVAEMACTREEIDFLFAAISTLSNRTCEVYLLRKFERLSQKEIAVRLGISANTVEVHVARANKHCTEFLRRRGVFRASEP
jgi:RNA polymerase sigma-70 factor (ECF subfamily)